MAERSASALDNMPAAPAPPPPPLRDGVSRPEGRGEVAPSVGGRVIGTRSKGEEVLALTSENESGEACGWKQGDRDVGGEA